MPKKFFSNKSGAMKAVLISMFDLIREILSFTTKISSENIANVVVDTNSLKEEDVEKAKLISQIDCRGHVIFDPETKQKNKFLMNMEKIL